MKKLLIFLAAIPFFISCDNIGEDERYITVEGVKAERRVLLQEFTGQRCVNCPAAHQVIEKLEEQYGEDLIVVSIHAGQFGIKAPAGLMQVEGDEYASRWNVTTYPCGVIDMTGGVLNSDSWATAIRNDLEKPTDLEIDIEAYVIDNNSINITTNMAASESVAGSMILWVVENGIVTLQLDGEVTRTDYVHNNVFRACVNGVWGQPVKIAPREEFTVNSSIAIDSKWNLDNIYIVGYVYNDSGVIQVNRCKVLDN